MAMTRDANVTVAMIFGWVLVVAGVLGFVLTPTLIIFGVNALHNLIHLATGAALLIAAYTRAGVYARATNITLGIIYLAVAILGYAGVLVPQLLNTAADTVMHADNTLHLLLGIVFLGVAFSVRATATRPLARA